MRMRLSILATLITAVVVTGVVLGGCTGKPYSSSTTTPATSTPVTTSTATGQSITINLVAQNITFDKKQITVPAGAAVTVVFNNKDSGVAHNFSVYQNVSGGQTKAIFVGQTIAGPNTITYHFTAPAAGNSYFFECDVHPTVMNGTFTVTP